MTATTGSGTDPHPEVSEISDLTEGLLPIERGAELREHIAGCALCTDVLESLTEIRALLGTLPGPQQMPADIAGRIDAALAAEAHVDTVLPGPRVPRGTSSVADVPRGTSTVTDINRANRPRRWRKGLLAAASVAAVVLIGGGIYEASSGGSGGSGSDSMKKADTSAALADPVGAQVHRLLAGPGSGKPPGKGADSPMLNGPGATAQGGARTPTAVPACVLLATQQSGQPLAADRQPYHGTDAYLVVFTDQDNPQLVDAFVVSASCSPGSPGQVLFQNTYQQ